MPRIGTSESHCDSIRCGQDRKDEDGARSDESKGESQRGRRQTQTKHERDRPQTAYDDANDSQALTGGDITRYKAPLARISYVSQDRPVLKFASMQVCCAMAKPSVRDTERVKRIGRYLAEKGKVLVPLTTEW